VTGGTLTGLAIFAAGAVLAIVFDAWWAVGVQATGGVIAVAGAWRR
jgi:hypothetical protein